MFLPRGSRSMSLLHARPCMFPPAICRRRGNVASGTLTALLGTNHRLETVTSCGCGCLLVPRSFMASNGMAEVRVPHREETHRPLRHAMAPALMDMRRSEVMKGHRVPLPRSETVHRT